MVCDPIRILGWLQQGRLAGTLEGRKDAPVKKPLKKSSSGKPALRKKYKKETGRAATIAWLATCPTSIGSFAV
jgi:hypothetical protein